MVFQSLDPNATYTLIGDDALSPNYIRGDYVAGIKVFGDGILNVINQICIVELNNDDILVVFSFLEEVNQKNFITNDFYV